MSITDAVALFQAQFQLLSQRIKGKVYGVRFIAAPYSDDAVSMLIFTDSRNPERIGGPNIQSLLQKFKIPEADFRAAYNDHFKER